MSANNQQDQVNNVAGPSSGQSTSNSSTKLQDNFLLVDPAVIMLLKLRGVELKKKSIVITPVSNNSSSSNNKNNKNNNNNNNNNKPNEPKEH